MCVYNYTFACASNGKGVQRQTKQAKKQLENWEKKNNIKICRQVGRTVFQPMSDMTTRSNYRVRIFLVERLKCLNIELHPKT